MTSPPPLPPAPAPAVLIVDDDPDVVSLLIDGLSDHGIRAEGTTSPRDALARVTRGDRFDVIVSDIEMPQMRGTDLMRALHAARPDQLVILITAFGSIDLGVQAVREGAADFITKPFRIEQLALVITRALRERQMRREIVRLSSLLDAAAPSARLVARSPAMRAILDLATRAARFDSSVLITGESGVGKGAVARMIHDQSVRASGPFLQVNAATLPEPLVESELFGVRRGAFTDAREDRPGLLLQAQGGTLLLDEVAELPLTVQPKLLLALETRRIRPVGATVVAPIDLRLISATNAPLDQRVRDGRFRADLFYRLNVIHIHIPPLRDRPEDIPPLIDTFLRAACDRLGRPPVSVTAPAMRWLLQQPWHGNARELSNTLERAVALSDHDALLLSDLSPAVPSPPPDPADAPTSPNALQSLLSEGLSLQQLEDHYLHAVLTATGGNKAEAARILGIDRRTLYRKLREP